VHFNNLIAAAVLCNLITSGSFIYYHTRTCWKLLSKLLLVNFKERASHKIRYINAFPLDYTHNCINPLVSSLLAIDLYRFRFFLINHFKKRTTTIDGVRGDTSFNGRCFTQGEILYTRCFPLPICKRNSSTQRK